MKLKIIIKLRTNAIYTSIWKQNDDVVVGHAVSTTHHESGKNRAKKEL